MSIYSNDNIRKIAKLITRELPQKSKNAKITVRENNGLYSMLKLTPSIQDTDTSIDFVQGPPGSRREQVTVLPAPNGTYSRAYLCLNTLDHTSAKCSESYSGGGGGGGRVVH